MPRSTTYKCKQCGTEKQSTNHWFLIRITSDGYQIYNWQWGIQNDRIDDPTFEIVCGQRCAHKELDKFFET